MRAFVSGEGRHDLGKWDEAPERRAESKRTDGVFVELVRKKGTVIEVCGGMTWRSVPKYVARGHVSAEEKTLRKLVEFAHDAGADTLIWGRDIDDDKSRQRQLEGAQAALAGEDLDGLAVRGGPVVPCIEAWVLALSGAVRHPEEQSPAKLKALAEEHGLSREHEMVELIRSKQLDVTRSDSLRNWLAQF